MLPDATLVENQYEVVMSTEKCIGYSVRVSMNYRRKSVIKEIN